MKHPHVNIKALIGKSSAGKKIADIFSKFKGLEFPLINTLEKTDLTNVDVLFSCTPSGVLADIISKIPKK